MAVLEAIINARTRQRIDSSANSRVARSACQSGGGTMMIDWPKPQLNGCESVKEAPRVSSKPLTPPSFFAFLECLPQYFLEALLALCSIVIESGSFFGDIFRLVLIDMEHTFCLPPSSWYYAEKKWNCDGRRSSLCLRHQKLFKLQLKQSIHLCRLEKFPCARLKLQPRDALRDTVSLFVTGFARGSGINITFITAHCVPESNKN